MSIQFVVEQFITQKLTLSCKILLKTGKILSILCAVILNLLSSKLRVSTLQIIAFMYIVHRLFNINHSTIYL